MDSLAESSAKTDLISRRLRRNDDELDEEEDCLTVLYLTRGGDVDPADLVTGEGLRPTLVSIVRVLSMERSSGAAEPSSSDPCWEEESRRSSLRGVGI